MLKKILIILLSFVIYSTNGSRPCTNLENGSRGRCTKIEKCQLAFNTSQEITNLNSDPNSKNFDCDTNLTATRRRFIPTRRSRMRSNNVRRVIKDYVDKKLTNHQNYDLIPQEKCGLSLKSTEQLKYPWMAILIYFAPNENKICSGSIINERYVLTSANCVAPQSEQPVFVRVGGHKPDLGIFDFPIDDIIAHNDFNREQPTENNIALIRLATPIPNVHPICLPFPSRIMKYDYKKLDVFHWENDEQSKEFKQSLLPIMRNNKCRQLFKNKDKIKISDNHICSGTGSGSSRGPVRSTCKATSGGALMLYATTVLFPRTVTTNKYIQVGVLSSDVLCDSVTPAIHTRVSSFIPWILNNIKM